MPLQGINLDDRRFEELFNEARRRIATYTPEWTDHNDSDPGVTFLQLACFLQEMLIYRLNQVPQKNYQKFLELVGLNLLKAAPAQADLTFTIAKGQTQDISAGTQVALGGGGAPLIFETDVAMSAVGVNLVAAQSYDGSQFTLQTDANAVNGPPGYPALSNTPQRGSALYLGFDQAFPAGTTPQLTVYVGSGGAPAPVMGGGNLSVLPAARMLANGCTQVVSGVGNPLALPSPPVQAYWEYWAGATAQWRRLNVINDTTRAFLQSGAVTFTAPQDAQPTQLGLLIKPTDPSLYWIRYRIDQVSGAGYDTPPMLEAILLNTVSATNAVTVQNVLLGAGNGLPNQTVQLPYAPVLPHPGVNGIIAIDANDGKGYVTWTEVKDFGASGSNDQHYTLDYATGLVTFGDGVHGAVAPWYSDNASNREDADQVNIIATQYQYGGGSAGNSAADTITTLLTPMPFVLSVTNQRPSYGGADEETVAQAQVRTPMVLRTSNRAVTGEDFAFLALQTPGAQLARAQAFPLLNPDFRVMRAATGGGAQVEAPSPGSVTVVVLPQSTDPKPMPSQGTLQVVAQWLDQFRLLTTELYVVAPSYKEITIQAQVIARPSADVSLVEAAVVKALLAYFNPLTGGPSGAGWDFGGTLYFSETYRQILDAPGVLRIVTGTLKTFVEGDLQPDETDVPLQPNELAWSRTHDIVVNYP
jgi:predicted phage baseplate assembly protein